MPIDYNIWGQHTIAEVRYGRETAIHVRIPAQVVMQARALFSASDLAQFNPHISLSEQLYQFHIFNGTIGDTYITDVPFEYVKQLLWYLHRHQQERDSLVSENVAIPFSDFKNQHIFSRKPGIVWLYVGHEKYGLFDLVLEGSFNGIQLHRAALYGAFLRDLDYVFKDRDIEDALPDKIKKQIENGASLKKAVGTSMDLRPDGLNTIHSILEALTLIVDEESQRLKKGNLQVCKQHNPHIYWTNYKGRRIYRIIDPEHPKAKSIERELEKIVEKECPICEEVSLVP